MGKSCAEYVNSFGQCTVCPPKTIIPLFIANPAFLAGSWNIATTSVTQALKYSRSANKIAAGSKRRTVFLPPPPRVVPAITNPLP